MIEKKACATFNRVSQLKLKNKLLRCVEGSSHLDRCLMCVAMCISFCENPPSAYSAQQGFFFVLFFGKQDCIKFNQYTQNYASKMKKKKKKASLQLNNSISNQSAYYLQNTFPGCENYGWGHKFNSKNKFSKFHQRPERNDAVGSFWTAERQKPWPSCFA